MRCDSGGAWPKIEAWAPPIGGEGTEEHEAAKGIEGSCELHNVAHLHVLEITT